jgi:hypothetical protein
MCYVDIATGYELDDQGVGVPIPVGKEFSLLHVVQIGSGSHPASYPMGTGGGLSQGVKLAGREADHSPPKSTEVEKTWVHTYIFLYAFMA